MTVLMETRVEAKTRTATAIKITSEIVESTDFNVFDDIFDGFIPFGDEDDRGGGDESCDSQYEECDEPAKHYVMFADPQGRQDCYGKLYLCPKHYVQYLHFILDSMRVNNGMKDLDGRWDSICDPCLRHRLRTNPKQMMWERQLPGRGG